MMAMQSLGWLQVLVRKMQPGADHQNAEVRVHIHHWVHNMHAPYSNTGIHIGGIQSGEPISFGVSVTITCTTDSPADSIMLLQDDQPLHGTNSQTTLMYTISVTDSIDGNIFKCEANLTGRTYSSNIAFDMVTISIKSKSIILLWI